MRQAAKSAIVVFGGPPEQWSGKWKPKWANIEQFDKMSQDTRGLFASNSVPCISGANEISNTFEKEDWKDHFRLQAGAVHKLHRARLLASFVHVVSQCQSGLCVATSAPTVRPCVFALCIVALQTGSLDLALVSFRYSVSLAFVRQPLCHRPLCCCLCASSGCGVAQDRRACLKPLRPPLIARLALTSNATLGQGRATSRCP